VFLVVLVVTGLSIDTFNGYYRRKKVPVFPGCQRSIEKGSCCAYTL
jgi:hypothetical protein